MKSRASLSLLALSIVVACPLVAIAQDERVVPSSVVDAVALYVVPTNGIDEQGRWGAGPLPRRGHLFDSLVDVLR